MDQSSDPQPPSVAQHVTNVYVTQQVHAPAYVAVAQPKNVAVAAILGLCFGPLGMLYVGVTPALIMFGVSLVAALFTFGIGLFITIPICAVWAALEAQKQNAALFAQTVPVAQGFAPQPAAPQFAAPQAAPPQPQPQALPELPANPTSQAPD
jgi:hypothetical protein